MKKRQVAIFTLLLAAALFVSGAAVAKESFQFYGWGPRAGFQADPDQLYFGAHFPMSSFMTNLLFVPSIDIGFGDDMTLLSINPDLLYQVPIEGVGSFYFGGVLAFQYMKFDTNIEGADDTETELGLHGTAGIRFKDNPFLIETMIGLDDAPDFKICVGYMFKHF